MVTVEEAKNQTLVEEVLCSSPTSRKNQEENAIGERQSQSQSEEEEEEEAKTQQKEESSQFLMQQPQVLSHVGCIVNFNDQVEAKKDQEVKLVTAVLEAKHNKTQADIEEEESLPCVMTQQQKPAPVVRANTTTTMRTMMNNVVAANPEAYLGGDKADTAMMIRAAFCHLLCCRAEMSSLRGSLGCPSEGVNNLAFCALLLVAFTHTFWMKMQLAKKQEEVANEMAAREETNSMMMLMLMTMACFLLPTSKENDDEVLLLHIGASQKEEEEKEEEEEEDQCDLAQPQEKVVLSRAGIITMEDDDDDDDDDDSLSSSRGNDQPTGEAALEEAEEELEGGVDEGKKVVGVEELKRQLAIEREERGRVEQQMQLMLEDQCQMQQLLEIAWRDLSAARAQLASIAMAAEEAAAIVAEMARESRREQKEAEEEEEWLLSDTSGLASKEELDIYVLKSGDEVAKVQNEEDRLAMNEVEERKAEEELQREPEEPEVQNEELLNMLQIELTAAQCCSVLPTQSPTTSESPVVAASLVVVAVADADGPLAVDVFPLVVSSSPVLPDDVPEDADFLPLGAQHVSSSPSFPLVPFAPPRWLGTQESTQPNYHQHRKWNGLVSLVGDSSPKQASSKTNSKASIPQPPSIGLAGIAFLVPL